jgi:hypothetical protein
MRRWLPVVLSGLVWVAPVAARADTPPPAACVYALPSISKLGVVGQWIAYSQSILCVPNGDAVSNPVIEWGDGTTSVGTITSQEPGHIVVTGAHIYTSPGTFKIRARVTDVVSGQVYSQGSKMEADIRPARLSATPVPCDAPVSDPPKSSSVSAVGCEFKVRSGSSVRSYEVAQIRARTPSAGLRATISWGDGTKSAGVVTGTGTGTLRVSGRHRWRHSGRHAIIVTLTNASGHVVAKATGCAVVVAGK